MRRETTRGTDIHLAIHGERGTTEIGAQTMTDRRPEHPAGLVPRGEQAKITVSTYQGRSGLDAIESQWQAIAATQPRKRFFHLFSWYRSYINTLETDPASVHFFVVHRDGVPTGLFPLKSARRTLFGIPFRTLEFPSHPHLDLSDVLLGGAPQETSLLKALVSYLSRQHRLRWDLIFLPNLLEDSLALRSLQTHPPARSSFGPRKRSGYLNAQSSFADALARIPGTFRRNLQRLGHRLERAGQVSFECYTDTAELTAHFDEFLAVEASGWKGSEGTQSAIRCEDSTTDFYRQLITGATDPQVCRIHVLRLDGKCIAGQFCMLVDGTLDVLKTGYDEAYAEFGPGGLIMLRTLRLCCEDPAIQRLSFVTEPPWASRWRAELEPVHSAMIFNRSLLGLAGSWYARLRPIIAKFSHKGAREHPAGPASVPADNVARADQAC